MNVVDDLSDDDHRYALRRSLLKAALEAVDSVLTDNGLPVDEWEDDLMGNEGTRFVGEWVAVEVAYVLDRLRARKTRIISGKSE